jgi:hypothetical protein
MRIATRLMAVAFVLGTAATAQAQSVDEVIEKSVAALGGRAAHAALKTRTMTGAITLSTPGGDIPGTIEIQNALPNKARTVIKADLTAFGAGALEIDQRFDGTTGFVLDSLQGNRDITGNQLDNLRNGSFPHVFLNYKAMGMTARLVGKEKLGERDVHVVSFQPAVGSTMKQYIDASTFLPVRMVMTVNVPQVGQDVEQTSDLSDYRAVDGVQVPFVLRSSSSIQAFTVTLAKVEHNLPIDDKLFAKP